MLVASAVSPVLCMLGCVQILAILAAAVSRLVQGTRHEPVGQIGLIAALAIIGGLCGATVRVGPGAAAACAVTLALMTLIAVADFSRSR